MPQLPDIDSFSGQYRWLSNFYPCVVYLNGLMFYSVENAYQAAKTNDRVDQIAVTRMTPAGAKRYCRALPRPEDWDERKEKVMLYLLRQKFLDRSDAFFLRKLQRTGDARLIEGNTWGDTYWGCVRNAAGEWEGKNRLGQMLMQVRGEI